MSYSFLLNIKKFHSMDPATGVAICSTALELLGIQTIIRHVRYFTNFKNNMEEFRDQLERFEARIDDIQEMVDAYRRNLQKPRNEVEVILNQCTEFKVKYTGDLENLKGLNLEGSVKYFSRYKLSKKTKDLEKRMMKLNVSNIDLPMELNRPPATVEKINNKYVEGLNSVEKTKAVIISAIKDVNTFVIGLQGMGGIGKTTLIQQINNEFRYDPHISFTYVIMVTVSDSPNIKNLQDQIGERVGLNFQGIESETGRANRLLERLENEKSILIILDDVWNALDLSTIGIPRGNGENKCCKIVLTTRNEDVCKQMNASTIITMAFLNSNEAWKLFESYSGVLEPDSIRKIAEDVCKECAGLPLAISVVASTLRHKKREYDWSNFLSELKESNFKELENDIEAKLYGQLKLSYDHLESDNQKLCFLFCSLFPEDYVIYVNDLMYYGLGEGFVTCRDKVSTLDRTLNLIDKLKSRGLLLDVKGRDEMYVKMHDVVRDVAISITRNEKFDFYSNFKDLTKWPEGGESETIKRISLMGNSIRHVVDHNPKFHGKQMKSLLLNDNESLETIADDFFEEMGDLHILDMRGTILKSLPTSFQKLMKLRVLAISSLYSTRGEISLRYDHLLSKKDLVVLILQDSRIPELTKEFGELVHLKVLDFTETKIGIIRPNLLSMLKKLEQLRMLHSFNRWNESDKNGNFVSFFELGSLERLYALEVEVVDVKFAMPSKEEPLNFLSSLKFFAIFLGGMSHYYSICRFDTNYYTNRLVLRSIEASESISNWIIVLKKKAKVIELDRCNWSKQLLEDIIFSNSDNMNSLKQLFISRRCKTSKVLIEYSENKDGDVVILPKVDSFNLEKLDEMENIFIIPIGIPVGSFQSLKYIKIVKCQALRSIFPWNVAVCLVHLENLFVRNCSSLEYVIVMGKEDNSDYYNNGQVLFPKLNYLMLYDLQNLKSLLWQQESEKGMENIFIIPIGIPVGSFQSLKSISFVECQALKSIFPWNVAVCLVHLKYLEVLNCSSLEYVIVIGKEDNSDYYNNGQVLFPRLRQLYLYNLQNLKSLLWQQESEKRMEMELSSLMTLSVFNCPKLKRLCFGEKSAPELPTFNCSSEEWFDELQWEDEQAASRFKSIVKFGD